jgi:NAD-dependent deacetylase sirtuin 2
MNDKGTYRDPSNRDYSDSDDEKNSNHSSDDENDATDDTPGFTCVEEVRRYLASKLGLDELVSVEDDDQRDPHVLESLDLEGISKYIKEGRATKVVTMAGAGISTSAGIPDFRSPGTGLYDNLEKYNLPSPQAIFDIRFYILGK